MNNDASSIIQFMTVNDKRRLSAIQIAIVCLITCVLSLISSHLLVIYLDKPSLDNYLDERFKLSRRIIFQVERSFKRIEKSEAMPCQEADLAQFRSLIKDYIYISDIGRIAGHQVQCSILETQPFSLDRTNRSGNFGHQTYSLNFERHLQVRHSDLAFVNHDIIVFIDKAYTADIELSAMKKDGIGTIIHNEDKENIYRIFGDINNTIAKKALAHKSSWIDYFPHGHAMITETRCSSLFHICTTVVDTQTGLFSMTKTAVVMSLTIGLFAGLLICYIGWLSKTGLNGFVRQLRTAINKKHISVVYQPQYKLSDHSVVGIEVLARWRSKFYGYVPPDIFIQLCEMNHLIDDLTKVVIEKSFAELSELLEQNTALTASVNVASSSLMNPELRQYLDQEIAKYKFNPCQIMLEITERTSGKPEPMMEAIKHLKESGYRISIDDFGTGMSNLSGISLLNPDEVKVDKMFTLSISTNSIANNVLENIIDFLSGLDVKKVFEGVETESQCKFLTHKIPGAYGQGYYFSKPVSIEQLRHLTVCHPPNVKHNESIAQQ
ncbi:Putative cyclic-di-GMP phosphodiesterase AdrB [Vibrio aerogenes CECT 7868]|uniref:cyclic-guanylate-specific phosphodiesterase n=1 Tax=Vibrio aerogenes CECT 7868 TaxID=1216006 RepID=A0A1M5ZKM3_9VIBR|nr:EAL domain-containing protein [Vibrio aerogenes]SHI24712.1 Putative cyclic-di-GMP phosphodiesterase AdrB [Vibrio aerogenes CECT 7868]